MANKVQLKAAGDQDFTNDDPFAELTRIMGFDPRVQPTPRPDEDFEIDLEKELMGMFDPGPDAPVGPAAKSDYPQETDDNFPASDEVAAELIDETFAASLEEELTGSEEFWAGDDRAAEALPEQTFAEDTDEAADVIASDAVASDVTGSYGTIPDGMADVDMEFDAPHAEYASQPPADEGVAEADDAAIDAQPAVSEDRNVYRPVFFDPGQPSDAGRTAEAEAPAASAPVFDIRSFKSAAQQYREAAPVQETIDEVVAVPAAEERPAPRAKAVDPFDILAALGNERGLPQRRDPLNAKSVAPEPVAEAPAQPDEPVMASVESEAPEPEIWENAPVADLEENDWHSEAAMPEVSEETAAQAASAEMEDMPFFDIRPAEAPDDLPAAAAVHVSEARHETGEAQDEAVAASDAASEDGDTPEIDTTEIEEPAVAIADDLDIPVPAFQTEVRAAPVYDELDEEFEHAFQALSLHTDAIRQAAAAPEESPAAGTSAEIERLFAEELGIGSASSAMEPQAAAAAGAAASAHGARDDDDFAFDESDFMPDEFAATATREVREAMAAADEEAESYAPRPAYRSLGRVKLLAAAVAGVAVLAGIGVFAFSGSGTDAGDKPLVLKADAHPVKVKPKNPGGMTVPNQDNKVYERVADGATAVAPEQKKLVSTEEQPIDISARAENVATALPGVFEGDQINALKGNPTADAAGTEPASDNGEKLASAADAPTAAASKQQDIAGLIKAAPKGEDRLTPSQDTSPKGADGDALTITPHKVRTMIVRADGTMVPREEPAPADAAPSNDVSAGASENASATALPSSAPVPTREPQAKNQAVAKADVAPAATPKPAQSAEVAKTPSRPADQPQKVASAEPAPAPAPVTQASGDWSVQIASQPTAEAAQTSYQNMARRYAGILGGHAVNIVKADISGKGTYYRVRIAASSKEDAIALCTKYKAAGGNCFVSK